MWNCASTPLLLAGLALGAALPGCAPTSPPPAAPAAPAVSYDGRYSGTIQVAGAAVSGNPRDCQTSPNIAFDVQGNKFVLRQPQILAVRNTPSLADSKDISYNATIGAGGRITGVSNQTNATMTGQAQGNTITGSLYGLLCYYDFSATRS